LNYFTVVYNSRLQGRRVSGVSLTYIAIQIFTNGEYTADVCGSLISIKSA